MTDSSPTPPNRQDPQLDPADDADEPAFDWMKPASADKRSAAASAGAAGTEPAPLRNTRHAVRNAPSQHATNSGRSDSGRARPAAVPTARRREAAVEPAPTGNGAHFSEPLPTSALQIRPPEEEVQRRNAEREHAANAKPVAPRVMQVLLAVFFPVILLVLAVRAVASPLFLWVEYNRPGFPGDGYGFSTDDRMTYGSYAVDYLSNWSGPRYLGELVNRSGDRLFEDGEVSHMADVKARHPVRLRRRRPADPAEPDRRDLPAAPQPRGSPPRPVRRLDRHPRHHHRPRRARRAWLGAVLHPVPPRFLRQRHLDILAAGHPDPALPGPVLG